MNDPAKFQEQFGYKFKNRALLDEALTHPTFNCERALHYDNQRLEFLGDAVVQIVMTDAIYRRYPDAKEGAMTKLRAVLVCEKSLAERARELGLNTQLLLGRGETAAGGSERDSALADCFEAFIGALYLDAGFDYTRERLFDCFKTVLEHLSLCDDSNAKGRLQEYCAKHALPLPVYTCCACRGPDHAKTYMVQVAIAENVIAEGEGSRIKTAEVAAAAAAYAVLQKENK